MVPKHTLNHTPVFIHESDPAWDQDKFKAYIDLADEERDGHPLSEYFSGKSRYNLDDPGLAEYLPDRSKAIRFVMRRLPNAKERQILLADSVDTLSMVERVQASYRILQKVLVQVKGLDDYSLPPIGNQHKEETINKLFEIIPDSWMHSIANACVHAQLEATESEKKS